MSKPVQAIAVIDDKKIKGTIEFSEDSEGRGTKIEISLTGFNVFPRINTFILERI